VTELPKVEYEAPHSAGNGQVKANFRSRVEAGPRVNPEGHGSRETEDSSLRFKKGSKGPTRQRPYRCVGKPRRYDDGNFETQFRQKDQTREQR